MIKKNILAISFLFIVFYMTECIFESTKQTNDFENSKTPVSSVFMKESEAENLQGLVPVRVFFINQDDMKLNMQIRYVDSMRASKSVEDLIGLILDEIKKGPDKDTDLREVWSNDMKLVSEVYFEGGIVLLDFNETFFKILEKDSKFEELIVYAIVNSLTEVRQVERVKFLKESQELEEYKGKLNINSLFHRNLNLRC